jgi:hypothetical protein
MTSLQHIRLRDGRFLSYRECGAPHGLPVIYNHGGTVGLPPVWWTGRQEKRHDHQTVD